MTTENNRVSKNFMRVALVIMTLAIAFALSAGVAWAVLINISETTQNSLTAGVTKCQVQEEFDGVTKGSVAVKNTGNVTSFVRVRLVSYWVNESGSSVGAATPDLSISIGEGWFWGDDGCLYAKNAVAPGAATPNLLGSPLILAKSGTYRQVVDVLAETIQAQPADAAAEAWGIAAIDGALVAQA